MRRIRPESVPDAFNDSGIVPLQGTFLAERAGDGRVGGCALTALYLQNHMDKPIPELIEVTEWMHKYFNREYTIGFTLGFDQNVKPPTKQIWTSVKEGLKYYVGRSDWSPAAMWKCQAGVRDGQEARKAVRAAGLKVKNYDAFLNRGTTTIAPHVTQKEMS